jgi:hypothetical protein
MTILNTERAVAVGFSRDKRKRRNQHRTAARKLLAGGTLFNTVAPRGSIPWSVAQWHLAQARAL